MENSNNSKLVTSSIIKTAKKAVATALLHHKAMGNEIVFWKDGKIIREKFTGKSTFPKVHDSRKSSERG